MCHVMDLMHASVVDSAVMQLPSTSEWMIPERRCHMSLESSS